MITRYSTSRPRRYVKGGSHFNRPALARFDEHLFEPPEYLGYLFGLRLVRRACR